MHAFRKGLFKRNPFHLDTTDTYTSLLVVYVKTLVQMYGHLILIQIQKS